MPSSLSYLPPESTCAALAAAFARSALRQPIIGPVEPESTYGNRPCHFLARSAAQWAHKAIEARARISRRVCPKPRCA